MIPGARYVATRAHMGVEVGDQGTLTFAAAYVPGFDAGCYTIQPDTFPDASHYGHLSVSYWTDTEVLDSWRPA